MIEGVYITVDEAFRRNPIPLPASTLWLLKARVSLWHRRVLHLADLEAGGRKS